MNIRANRKTKDIIRQIMQCKADGICERDKLVSMWVEGCMITNNALREAVVEAVRDKADLPPCPPICDGQEPEPCEPDPCEPKPCCTEEKAEVVDEIL